MQKQRNKITGRVIGVLTIILVGVRLVFGTYNFEPWTLEEFVKLYSFLGQSAVLSWRPSTYLNRSRTTLETFHMTPSNVVICISTAIPNFFGWMQEYMMHSIVLLIAIGVHKNVLKFVAQLSYTTLPLERKWKMYEEVKLRMRIINEPLSVLLPLLHINNALLIAHFLFDALEKNKTLYNIILSIHVVVVLYVYYLAARTSQQVPEPCTLESGSLIYNLLVVLSEVFL